MVANPVSLHPLAYSSVLVTGGTGAFGRAFVDRALVEGARRIVVLSRDEAKQAKAKAEVDDPRVRWFVGDVRDADRVWWAMRGCDMVVHAAAMKRVDSCEFDPQEAIDTNITGSGNVAAAAIRQGVTRAVFLSTDKAAAPSTLYGLTKSTAERLWVQSNTYAAGTSTRLAVTRYGNVLASTGSVIPMWQAEVAQHSRITITDPNATRFWMPMSAAVDLVMMALQHMRGGETFIPKLRAATVRSLATALHPDVQTRIVGLQAGEKLHETLVGEDEAARTFDCNTHYVIRPALTPWIDGTVPYTGTPVAPGFVLRSDTAPRWDVNSLREMTQ